MNCFRLRMVFCFALFSMSNWASADTTKQPNIVLIYADDLDADEIGCTMDDINTWPTPSGAKRVLNKSYKAGSPKVHTPHIDKMAEVGMTLTRFYVNATVCSSSRYSLLTGRYACRGPELLKDYPAGEHLTLEWRPALLRSETSLSKELQKVGYRTGIIGKWHNMENGILPKRKKADHQPNASYEHTKKAEARIKAYYKAGVRHLSKDYGWDVVDRMEWGNSIVNLDWQCEGAVQFIEESQDQPFFLYCALPVPHGQYHFGYNQIETYDRRVTSNGVLEQPCQFLPSDEDVFRRTDAAQVERQNAMATRMDDYVGAIIDKLKKLKLMENTLVIFTSDHGSRGKNSCYEGGAKVPLLALWPGKIEANSKNDSLAGSVDIAATLLEIAGANTPKDMSQDGLSLVPQLLGQGQPENWRSHMLIEAGNTKAVLTRDWKFLANRVTAETAEKMAARPQKVYWTGLDHHNYGNERMYPSFWDPDQLFDLKQDLYEQSNLIEKVEYKSVLNQLQGHLSAYLRTLPHTFGEFK